MEDFADENLTELIRRCRAGDQDAATLLFRKYVDRLIGLVRARMSQKLSRRVDAEDILQSAYRSFFKRLGNGQFEVEQPEELWGLLAAIALHKLYRQVEFHTAKKRSVQREQANSPEGDFFDMYPDLIAHPPAPSEAEGVVEEIERIKSGLEPLEQKMLEMRLDGYGDEEIARHVDRSSRTVRRLMEKVRAQLQLRLMQG